MSATEGRTQNLRDFTVQIRHATTGAVVGTGVVVSNNGQVVTCAHVVLAAGVNPRTGQAIPSTWQTVLDSLPGRRAKKPLEAGTVGVYFPQARGGEAKARRATVTTWFPKHDDDVVLLQLVDGPAPLGPEQIAVLGTAEKSCEHAFRSYGYRRLGDYVAGWASGAIQGCVELPEGSATQVEPVELQSSQIKQGMSGAAVLDTERNLVVGLVAETWFPDRSTKDRDTAWAVDARVLTFDPFNFPMRQDSLPLRPAPQPKTDIAEARAQVARDLGVAWNNAPPPLAGEWAGRDDLLRDLSADWADPARRVTGLIGFGGEGKSSLARRWVETLLAENLSPTPSPKRGGESVSPFPLREGGQGVRSPDAVFWWGFYERPSVDQFFEAALDFLAGGRIDPGKVPSASIRAQIIGAMLGAGRYLFVLDGLEVLQHQEGDQYGLLKSADLRDLLTYFAAPGHASFCLVTSRAPLLDLLDYPTYTQRDVERLSPADGRALLRNLGVTGPDAALDQVVADWDGHALTLSLLGGYLAERYAGDVTHIGEIPPPVPSSVEGRYDRVGRVLRRYDEHLSDAERAFLALFSAFRVPVDESAFEPVFLPFLPRSYGGKYFAQQVGQGGGGAGGDGEGQLASLAQRLVAYRLLRRDASAHTATYTAHPLVRAHYATRLAATEPTQVRAAHARIKDHYLALAGDIPLYPTLDDLAPLIEAVHHACCADTYDEGHRIYRERIDQGERWVISDQLAAYETELALLLEFFPSGDVSKDPQVNDPIARRYILNGVGVCLTSIGRLNEAMPFFKRSGEISIDMKDRTWTSCVYRNLSELYSYLGELMLVRKFANQALALARLAEDKEEEWFGLTCQGWGYHLCGEVEDAQRAFCKAEELLYEIDSSKRSVYDTWGIWHADCLRRAGNLADARRVTEANLQICELNRWVSPISQCYRVLGDLDVTVGQHESARRHYDAALKLARGISRRDVLIEALLARGHWAARYAALTGLGDPSGLAFADLNEALGYAVESGYRIYEADIRVALAWAHRAAGNPSAARAEAERARRMSEEMGYHWGQVDAAEVLAALGEA